jgi:hypothetical protein
MNVLIFNINEHVEILFFLSLMTYGTKGFLECRVFVDQAFNSFFTRKAANIGSNASKIIVMFVLVWLPPKSTFRMY